MSQRPSGCELCVRDMFRANPSDFSASERTVCQRPTVRPDEVTVRACGRILTPDIDVDYNVVEDYADSPQCANELGLPTGRDRLNPNSDFL